MEHWSSTIWSQAEIESKGVCLSDAMYQSGSKNVLCFSCF
jgi:hypothetical protein